MSRRGTKSDATTDATKGRQNDDIDRASDASFPASDPPPWTLGSAPSAGTSPPVPMPAGPRAVVTTLPGLGPPNLQGSAEIAADFDVATRGQTSPTAAGADVTRAPRRRVGNQASMRGRVDTVALARLQGGYFAVTGAWPLLHMRSFRYVTGGKKVRERWLVKTVGVLVGAIGATLLASTAKGKRPDSSIRVLGTTSALGLLAIDVWYAATRRISPIYLLDAAAEAVLAAGWALARAEGRRR